MLLAFPLRDDSPKLKPASVTYGIAFACLLVFVWELGLGRRVADADLVYGMVPAVLFGFAGLPARVHSIPPAATLISSIFLHASWLHLAGNMLYLWLFGRGVEAALGPVRYLILFLVCGVAAGLIQALIDPASRIPMVGASGAIAGVLGSYFVLFPRARITLLIWVFFIVRIIGVPAVYLLALWLLFQIVSAALVPGGTPGVAFGAHVGGFAVGAALMALFRPGAFRPRRPQR